MIRFFLAVTMVCCAATLSAAWQLDNERSTLSFVTIKKTHIAEVNTFTSLSGLVSEAGEFAINIDLASVVTNIPIRDERMREYLFETDRFGQATLSGRIDMDVLAELDETNPLPTAVEAELSLHGEGVPLTLRVSVVEIDENTLVVNSRLPVVVHADDFRLHSGVEKLRELAGLPSISHAVPVTFSLTFTRQTVEEK